MCDCDACKFLARGNVTEEQAMALIRQHDRSAIEKYGWTAHYLVGTYPHSVHTHGLQERFGHKDLQIVLHMAPERLAQLLNPLVEALVAGRTFGVAQEVTDLFSVPVRFREYQEGGRTVLRAVFPDEYGRWPEDPTATAAWRAQLLSLNEA